MLQGATLSFEGWAANGEHHPPSAITAFVDGLRVSEGECGLSRPDVVARRAAPGLAKCGFRIVLASDRLARGMHRLAFAFSFEGAPDEMTENFALEVYTRDVVMPPTQAQPRILVVASPKSGSSYAVHFLLNYFRIDHLTLHDYSFEQEHVLTERLIEQLDGRPFVMQLHMLPRVPNVEALTAHAIAPVVTWRNLADTVISYDDHVRNEGVDSAAGTFTYINDRPRYQAMPEQSRYQFLIRHMLPWYIDFYLGWRDVNAPLFMHYERIVDDPAGYFAEIIETLSGTVDERRLRGLIGRHFEGSRFNVGRNGRALEKMSEETRNLLEESLRGHYADLHELIDELPWRGPHGLAVSEAGH